MNYIWLTSIGFIAFLSCVNSKEKEVTTNENNPKEFQELRDTLVQNKTLESPDVRTVLKSGYEIKQIDGVEWDMIFDTLNFEAGNHLNIDQLVAGLSADYEIAINILTEDGLTHAYTLNIGDYDAMSVWGELSKKDLDGNGVEEIVFDFENNDGNSGFSEGYEYTEEGLCIIDLKMGKVVFQESNYYHYMEYSGPENQGDVHAKVHEESDVSSCDYRQEIKITGEKIIIGELNINNQDFEACEIPTIPSGVYIYDGEKGEFLKSK